MAEWITPLTVHIPDTYIKNNNNVYIPGLARPDRLLEERYTGSRQRENKHYPDEDVQMLPLIAGTHPHYQEWLRRKASSQRLIRYLAVQKKAADILEIGCGNGWLSAQLATVPGSRVVGLDLNLAELQQAARVFHRVPNLKFMYGDFQSDILQGTSFDIIVFAASIQYFPSLTAVLQDALLLLRRGGEIHLLDSRLYKWNELAAARKATAAYYTSLQFPEMAEYTFHPCIQDLETFNHRTLFDPGSLRNRLLRALTGGPARWFGAPSSNDPSSSAGQARQLESPWICISKPA